MVTMQGVLYEDAGVDASRGGGGCKEEPVKGSSETQTASVLLAQKCYELMYPEDLYIIMLNLTKRLK